MTLNILQSDDACRSCLKCYAKKHDFKKGDKFDIQCSGIPKQYVSDTASALLSTDFRPELVLDPVKWAAEVLDWHCLDPDKDIWARKNPEEYIQQMADHPDRASKYHRPYQATMLRCNAQYKVFRIGRQSGKTETLVISMLFHMFTNANYKIVLITPFQSQIDLIFKRVEDLIYSNPTLANSIKRSVKAPQYTLELHNGSQIKGFTAGTKSGNGAASVRGQSANMLVFDEADYLDRADLDAAMAIITNYPDATVWMSSTPTGRREKFYEICHDREWKEFHFPSHVNPNWSERLDRLFKKNLTAIGYKHEILAEFGEQEEGVFQAGYVDAAMQDYTYVSRIPSTGWLYSIGVDWNSPKIGTTIYVTGFNPATNKFMIVEQAIIQRAGWTQTAACERLIELNRKWRPFAIYVDQGYGSCLGPQTLVSTIGGAKYLQDIVPGDKVLSTNGKYHVVNDIISVMKDRYAKIKIAKHPEIISSEEHKFFIYRSKNRFKDKDISPESFQWIRVDELNPDIDFAIIPKPKLSFSRKSKTIDITEYLPPGYLCDDTHVWYKNSNCPNSKKTLTTYAQFAKVSIPTLSRLKANLLAGKTLTELQTKTKVILDMKFGSDWVQSDLYKVNRYLDIANEDFLEILGWYISEGNTTKQSIVELSQKKETFMDNFESLPVKINNVFPNSYCSITKTDKTRIFFGNKIIGELFKSLGGHLCQNKKIHEVFNDVDISCLLKTCFMGDGHITQNYLQFSVTSKDLVYKLRDWFLVKNILPALYHVPKRTKQHKDQYRIDVNLTTESIGVIDSIFNTSTKLRTKIYRQKDIVLNDYILVPVEKVTLVNDPIELVDIEVEGSHTFTGNGVSVHNTQIEILRKYGYDARIDPEKGPSHIDSKLPKIVKSYDFGSAIEIRDPFTKELRKKPAKGFLVESAVRRFESGDIIISKHDEQLKRELLGYIVKHVTVTGQVVYTTVDDAVGDHNLDAMMLSLVAFTLEKGPMGKPVLNEKALFTPIGAKTLEDESDPIAKLQQEKEKSLNREQLKPADRGQLNGPDTSAKRKLWSWPGFEHDAPQPLRGGFRGRSQSSTIFKRPNRGPSKRSSF